MLSLNHHDVDPRYSLDRLKAEGWDCLRRNVWSTSEALRVLNQHKDARMEVLFLLDEMPGAEMVMLARAVSQVVTQLGPAYIEVGNEWDRKGVTPEEARTTWLDCLSQMDPRVTLVTGGTSSVSLDSYYWLMDATADLPRNVIIGIHGYPGRNDPQNPQDDPARYSRYRLSRYSDRTYWITEVGWGRGPRPRPFPLCWLNQRRSEEEQAECFAVDARLAREAYIPFYCAYQVADGPDPSNPEDCHGLYRDDGSARPSVPALVRSFNG